MYSNINMNIAYYNINMNSIYNNINFKNKILLFFKISILYAPQCCIYLNKNKKGKQQ